jgi:DNA replication protein DnaC
MTRKVRNIGASPDNKKLGEALAFSEFAEMTNLIVLGEPGSGKSHLFHETANAEGATFIKARSFLVVPAISATFVRISSTLLH